MLSFIQRIRSSTPKDPLDALIPFPSYSAMHTGTRL